MDKKLLRRKRKVHKINIDRKLNLLIIHIIINCADYKL